MGRIYELGAGVWSGLGMGVGIWMSDGGMAMNITRKLLALLFLAWSMKLVEWASDLAPETVDDVFNRVMKEIPFSVRLVKRDQKKDNR